MTCLWFIDKRSWFEVTCDRVVIKMMVTLFLFWPRLLLYFFSSRYYMSPRTPAAVSASFFQGLSVIPFFVLFVVSWVLVSLSLCSVSSNRIEYKSLRVYYWFLLWMWVIVSPTADSSPLVLSVDPFLVQRKWTRRCRTRKEEDKKYRLRMEKRIEKCHHFSFSLQTRAFSFLVSSSSQILNRKTCFAFCSVVASSHSFSRHCLSRKRNKKWVRITSERNARHLSSCISNMPLSRRPF